MSLVGLYTLAFTFTLAYLILKQQFLFAAQNILTPDRDPSGFKLLQCIQAYVNMTVFADLDVQILSTI
jgi:hypothetical protein